jgi:fructokinase
MNLNLSVIGLGEVLWDVLPEGKKLGGAPCNFVYHCLQQGAQGSVISTVDVSHNEKGIPEYTIHENVSWITLEKVLNTCKQGTLMVYDINLRQHYYDHSIIENSLQLCNVLKMNEEELPVVCELLEIKAEGDEDKALQLMKRFNLKLVALTKGINGSLLFTPSERSYLPTPRVKVKDTVGAGDAFTAVMSLGFANGRGLGEIHRKAVDVSAFVCTRDGAMPKFN